MTFVGFVDLCTTLPVLELFVEDNGFGSTDSDINIYASLRVSDRRATNHFLHDACNFSRYCKLRAFFELPDSSGC